MAVSGDPRDRTGGRFDGCIAGIGTVSGLRAVVGHWPRSPFGPFSDVMVERPDGHRVLLAPSAEVAEFVGSTYRFDEVRVVPVTVAITVAGARRRQSRLGDRRFGTRDRADGGAGCRTGDHGGSAAGPWPAPADDRRVGTASGPEAGGGSRAGDHDDAAGGDAAGGDATAGDAAAGDARVGDAAGGDAAAGDARAGDAAAGHGTPTAPTVGARWRVTAGPLELAFDVGGRPVLGYLLRAVPRPLATAPWWISTIDGVARYVLPGVRTRGSAGNGRREYYAALDLHRITAAAVAWDGADQGGLAPVDPPVRFGFGSTPREPSLARIVTLVR